MGRIIYCKKIYIILRDISKKFCLFFFIFQKKNIGENLNKTKNFLFKKSDFFSLKDSI